MDRSRSSSFGFSPIKVADWDAPRSTAKKRAITPGRELTRDEKREARRRGDAGPAFRPPTQLTVSRTETRIVASTSKLSPTRSVTSSISRTNGASPAKRRAPASASPPRKAARLSTGRALPAPRAIESPIDVDADLSGEQDDLDMLSGPVDAADLLAEDSLDDSADARSPTPPPVEPTPPPRQRPSLPKRSPPKPKPASPTRSPPKKASPVPKKASTPPRRTTRSSLPKKDAALPKNKLSVIESDDEPVAEEEQSTVVKPAAAEKRGRKVKEPSPSEEEEESEAEKPAVKKAARGAASKSKSAPKVKAAPASKKAKAAPSATKAKPAPTKAKAAPKTTTSKAKAKGKGKAKAVEEDEDDESFARGKVWQIIQNTIADFKAEEDSEVADHMLEALRQQFEPGNKDDDADAAEAARLRGKIARRQKRLESTRKEREQVLKELKDEERAWTESRERANLVRRLHELATNLSAAARLRWVDGAPKGEWTTGAQDILAELQLEVSLWKLREDVGNGGPYDRLSHALPDAWEEDDARFEWYSA